MKPSERIQRAFEHLLSEEKERLFAPIAAYLAEKYNNGDAVEIANLCDDRLDPSGNLLGWVREAAGKLRNTRDGDTP